MRGLLVLLLCLLALLLLIGFDQVEARKRRKKGLQGQNVPAKTNSNNKNGEEHANHKGTNSQKSGKTGHKNRRTGDAEEGPHQQKSPKNGDDHANHKGANNSQKPGKRSDNEKKTGHKNRRTGEAEEGPHQQKSSKHLASDFKHVKVPDAEQHKLFLECTVKQRVKPGNKKSILKTLFAHTAMGHNSALFYDTYFSSKYPDLSYNAFVASRSLLTLCEEDDTATKPPAIEIVSESYENGKVELRLAGGKNIEISKRSSSGALGKCQDHKGEPYQIFKCTGDLCDGTEVVLTQRPSRWNIEQSYFAKTELPELEKVCGLGETMHEVFDKGSKVHEGQKTKQHKLFRECAVKRSDNNRIETLVMYRPVSSRQTLFFSKGSHLYVAKRTATVREVCETKAGNMAHSVPIVHAVLTLAGQQEGKKKKKRNDNKILFHESGQSAAETLGIDVRDMDSDGKRICSAYTKKSGGGYHLFLCPPNVCGKTRLFMLRKRKMKQQESLIDMADGEHVFIDRLCVVDLDENVLQALMRRCNNKLGMVEGLTRDDEKLKKKTNKNKQKNNNKNQKKKKNKKGNQMDDDEEEANPNDNNKDNEHDVHENKDEKHHEKDGENAAEASYTRDGQHGKKEKGEQKQKQKMENNQQQKQKVQNNQQQKLKTPKLKPKAASAEAVMGNRKHSSMEDAKHNNGQKRRAASAELHKEKAEQHQQQHKGKEETAAAPNHNGKADAKPQKVAIDTDKLANSNNHNGNGAANNHESKSRQSKLKNKSAGF